MGDIILMALLINTGLQKSTLLGKNGLLIKTLDLDNGAISGI